MERLSVGPEHEDVHTAVEDWLTRRIGPAGERLHTGRSRNDQIACDLRLYLKDRLLLLQDEALDLVDSLLSFAQKHQHDLWPGYTHQRRAMPSSAGLWASAFAEGILDTVEALPSLWTQVDRSPLGSAAGYGVPLPLKREVAARALGFGAIEHNVALVQNGRGKLEAGVLFWCTQLGHELAKLSSDVILFSADEFGFLILPADLATGSSIMPHKRNPDLFELTRSRAAALEGELMTLLQVKAKLPSGYHRDFQLLKEPLMRGVDRLEGMLSMLTVAVPRLAVDPAVGRRILSGGPLATDEVMRRVESGRAFRSAYREVAAAIREGDFWREPATAEIIGAAQVLRARWATSDFRAAQARLRAGRNWGHSPAPPVRLGARPVAWQGRQTASRMTADRRKRQLKILELISTRPDPDPGGIGGRADCRRMERHAVIGESGHRGAAAGEGRWSLSASESDWSILRSIRMNGGSSKAC